MYIGLLLRSLLSHLRGHLPDLRSQTNGTKQHNTNKHNASNNNTNNTANTTTTTTTTNNNINKQQLLLCTSLRLCRAITAAYCN